MEKPRRDGQRPRIGILHSQTCRRVASPSCPVGGRRRPGHVHGPYPPLYRACPSMHRCRPPCAPSASNGLSAGPFHTRYPGSIPAPRIPDRSKGIQPGCSPHRSYNRRRGDRNTLQSCHGMPTRPVYRKGVLLFLLNGTPLSRFRSGNGRIST